MAKKKDIEAWVRENEELVLEMLGVRPFVLFEYDLGKLSRTRRQIFSHALYGSGGRESFLKPLKGEKMGDRKVIVPSEKSEEMKLFFKTWELSYKLRRLLM